MRPILSPALVVLAMVLCAGEAEAADRPAAPSAPEQPQARDAAAPDAGPTDAEDGDLAYKAALMKLFPLSGPQVRQFKQQWNENQRTVQRPVEGLPACRSRAVDLSQKSNEASPKLMLFLNKSSAVTLSDVTGQPWPILKVVAGNPAAYKVDSVGPESKSNIITVTPLVPYAYGNLVVTLVGSPVPISIDVEVSDKICDDRVDIRVGKRGPNAVYDIINSQSLPPTGDETMLAFLDGTPPDSAAAVQTSDHEVESWRYKNQLYVRTRYPILSPAYISKSTNVSGITVYAMKEYPALLLSRDGHVITVYVNR